MQVSLTIDRFEGDKKDIAVLIDDGGDHTINWPRVMLPKGAKAGDVLTFEIGVDAATTQKVAAQTKAVQEDLKRTDPGGNIKL